MAKRGRKPLTFRDAYLADRRFEELRAEGMGITEAEEQMMTESWWSGGRINCPQGIRKRRERMAWFGFLATALLS